jgi:4-amino-4-deoxy-L-arabinose transferase-like glycosyltransferase
MVSSSTAAPAVGAQRTRVRRSGNGRRPTADGPSYAGPAFAGILVMAAVLFGWDIQHSGYHAFYSETARSMSESWKGFLFGSFDPGNSISIDKLPGFLWPQALSVRIFGFHPWALTLPQVIEGVLSVVVLHRAVRRWAGPGAGLLAAGAFALTPAIAGMYRTEAEDPAFTLLVLLAADATLRAAREARLRPLLAAGVWVGLGFQAKMLEAWAVLPSLGLVYAVSAPARLRRRLAHLAGAGAVCLAVSASWVLLVTLTPAGDRPYMDGTTDNSAVSQVVGYNFLTRFSSLGVNAADTGSVSSSVMAGTAPATGSGGAGRSAGQWGKLFGPQLASQTGWLYPAAALSAVCGVAWRRGRARTDPLRAGFLLWGTWLATYVLVFSAGQVGAHTYYMGVVAVALAALFGAGTVRLWRAWQAADRTRAWALPTAVVTTVAWSALIAGRFASFLPWLVPVTVVLAAGALTALAVSRAGARRRTALLGLGLGVVAMLLPSAAWASSVLDPVYGHSGFGSAGPVAVARYGRPRTAGPGHPMSLDGRERAVLAYTRAHQGGAAYVFAVTSWRSASPYILYAGARVLPMGGFTGAVPSPTTAGFQRLVTTGRLRYVLLGGPLTRPGLTIAVWVRGHCARVRHTFRFPHHWLYHCSARS